MSISQNVISISSRARKPRVDGIVVGGEDSNAGLAPISRTLLSVYGAIDDIMNERTSMIHLVGNSLDRDGAGTVEHLLQRVRINTRDLQWSDIECILMLTENEASRHNITVYRDPNKQNSILIESMKGLDKSQKANLKKVVG